MTVRVQDFEDGTLPSSVTVEDTAWGLQQKSFALGSNGYCFGPDSSGNGNQALKATWREPELDPNGLAVPYVRVRMYETSSQGGSGIMFFDPNGNEICAVGSNNNQWNIKGAAGREQVYGGDSYEVWMDYKVEFDWKNGQITFDITDPGSGTNNRYTRDMVTAATVYGYAEIRGGLWNSNENYHWWDNLEIDIPGKKKVSGTISEEGSTGARNVYVYATDLTTLFASTTSTSDGTYSVQFRTSEEKGYVIAEGSSGHRSMVHGPLTFDTV